MPRFHTNILRALCLAPGSPFSLASWDYSISSNISLVIHDDNISHLQPAGHDEVSNIHMMNFMED